VCSKGEPCPVGESIKKSALEEYRKKNNLELHQKSSALEVEGYMKYTRVEELIKFAEAMGWKKLGIAFCIGLSEEARRLHEILKTRGFEVSSVVCKVGSLPKDELSLPKLRGEESEPACNPILQAKLLNEAGTDLNILVGLCMGHDVLFQKYSKAPTTTLIVKDRVLAHNPAGALYSCYHFNKLAKK
jgi:uncharacterized metal-binding protein